MFSHQDPGRTAGPQSGTSAQPTPLRRVEVADQQTALAVEPEQIRSAVCTALDDAGIEACEISVALVDDPTIHELNVAYLEHDYPTDVLSFPLSGPGEPLVGEVIASSDTAIENAARFDRTPGEELLLYIVHGTLHLAGFDDKNPEDAQAMRQAEARVLAQLAQRREADLL